MSENNIRFEHIRVGDLPDFAKGIIEKSGPGQFVPITMQRAVAHAHNPYADPEDIGMLVAVDQEDEVVGYFGIMPMLLRVNSEQFKTHWFTTWSVSSKVRGQGVGTRLMEEALKLNLDFLIVGSVHARRVCEKFGFWEREPLHYYWIDMSGMGALNPLTGSLRFVRKLVTLLNFDIEIKISNRVTHWIDRVFSPITKRVFYQALTSRLEGDFRNFSYRKASRILIFPEGAPRPKAELYRGIEAVNWMLAYPWVVETGNSLTADMDYYFSDVRPLYRLIPLELTDPHNGAYLGFVVFSVSQKGASTAVKTLDFKFTDPSKYHHVLTLALHLGREYNADTIEVPDEVASPLKDSLLGGLLLQPKTRIYQCHPKSDDSPLADVWHEITLHLYDGDMAFS
jgi:hypothetical protein